MEIYEDKDAEMYVNKNTKEYVCDSGRDIRFHGNSFYANQEQLQEEIFTEELDFCQ